MEHIVMVPVERYLEMKCAEEKLQAAVEELRRMQTTLNGAKEMARIFEQLRDKKLDDPLIDDEDLSAGKPSAAELANILRRCAGEDLCTNCPFADYIEDRGCIDLLMEAAANALDELLEH